MNFKAYGTVLRIKAARSVMLLGLMARLPFFGLGVVLTLYVIERFDVGYGAAGVIGAALTIGVAISAPYRGHLLDKIGLRKTCIPSLVVLLPTYTAMAFATEYWMMIPLAALTGVMSFPLFSITRSAVIGATPPPLRRAAISLDSTFVEVSFMLGPPAAVGLAVLWSERWTFLVCAYVCLVGCAVITWLNPSLKDAHAPATDLTKAEEDRAGRRPRGLSWVSPRALGILASTGVAGFILSGTDLAIIAALKAFERDDLIGLTLAAWGLGSAVAGLAYGTLKRPISVLVLCLGLGLTTALVAAGATPWLVIGLLMVAGVFCAPTLVAGIDQLNQAVSDRFRGQVMGWQGSFMTTGNALAPPLVGYVMDTYSWQAGFLLAGGLGVVAALGLMLLIAVRRRRGLGLVEPA